MKRLNAYAPAYPPIKVKSVDVIAADGAVLVGCEVADGKIIPALGAARSAQCAFKNVKAAGYSAAAGAYLVCADGKAFYSADGLNFSPLAALEGERPFVFEQRDNGGAKLYAFGDGNCVYYGGGAGGSNTLDCGICGGQFKSGRLFGIDKTDNFTLRWSGEGGAFDWEEGINGAGWLKLDGAGGKILNLAVYGERLVAVRENCLSVISAFGTPENFKAESKNLYVSGVCANTAAVAGNKLYFYAGGAGGGLYCFNGAKITKAVCPFAEEIQNPSSSAADGGLYFISAYAKPLGRRAVLVYDTESGGAHFADFPADILLSGGGVFAYADGCACKLSNGRFTFKSGAVNFGSAKEKYLKTVEIDGDGSAEIEISNGRTSRKFAGAKHALTADMRGAIFTFTVKSDAKIRSFKAVAEVTDGV